MSENTSQTTQPTTARGPLSGQSGTGQPPSDAAGDGRPAAGSSAPAGRDPATGRFTSGNKAGTGNPNLKKIAAIRRNLLEAVTPERLTAAIEAVLRKATEEGDVIALREILDRLVGRRAVIKITESEAAELGEDAPFFERIGDPPNSGGGSELPDIIYVSPRGPGSVKAERARILADLKSRGVRIPEDLDHE